MSLLTIAQAAADEIGLRRPAAVIGSGDAEVQQLLRYANSVGKLLVVKGDWQILRTERPFTALAGQTQTGILPADFNRFVPETFWDRTYGRLISGPITSVRYQSLQAKNYTGFERWFTLIGGAVKIFPAMAGGENLAFEYFSGNFCASAGGAPQNAWAADVDVSRLPEELFVRGIVWMFNEQAGQPVWQNNRQAFMDRLGEELRNDQPDNMIMSAGDMFGGTRNDTGTPSSNSAGGIFG